MPGPVGADPQTMSTIPLPSPEPADERAGGGMLFFGIAIPYFVASVLIAAGLAVGGTIGFVVAFGSLMFLLLGVFVGIWRFIATDDDE